MKHLLLLLLSLLGIGSQTMAQNPYWAFPPNYVDFNTGTVNTLGGGGVTKYDAANGIFSLNGTLQLYSAVRSSGGDIKHINRSDVTMGAYDLASVYDFGYVPVPGSCNTYLVPTNDFIGSYKYKQFSKITFNGTSGACTTNPSGSDPWESSWYLGELEAGMAVPPTPNLSSVSGEPYLYIVGGMVLGSTYGVTFDIKFVQSNNFYEEDFFWTPSSTPSSGKFEVVEAEVSHDGTKLAVCFKGWNKILLVNNVKACTTGTCNNSNITEINISGATAVNGIEFSPNGSILFYTKNSTSNQIGYVTLSSGTQSDVANSGSLGSSQLEYAKDGYMYVSDGSNLKGFNLNTPYTVSKIISGVSNAAKSGIYTLPDQIDGMDYSSFEGCLSGNVTYTSSPVPSKKVSGTITVSTSATVSSGTKVVLIAGSKISLQSGFKAVNGSNFVAKIASCPVTCSAVSCTLTTYNRTEEEVIQNKIVEEKIESIYPNPTKNTLYFGRTVNSFDLLNNTGTEVKHGSNTNKLDVSDLPKGLYLLKIDDRTEKVLLE